MESDSVTIDQINLETEGNERIKLTRQIIAEARESFDNQLKIQNLSVVELMPTRLHCSTLRLMEVLFVDSVNYND
ncbi:hypothetical protein CUMW_111280 [Citrus unshiu]|nr:hypothetical protein CUMW_111280 [Citrus unshiu]